MPKIAKQKWWIKERDNPQLGRYFILCGQMGQRTAKQYETGSVYGRNIMHSFDTEDAYNERIQKLRDNNESIQ